MGTFTVNGTDAADNFTLTERQINADPGEPGYGETRPVGIDVAVAGGNEQGGSLNLALGSTIKIVVNAGKGKDAVTNAIRFASTLNGGEGNDTLDGGAMTDYLRAGSYNDPFWGVNEFYSPHGVFGNDDDNETIKVG